MYKLGTHVWMLPQSGLMFESFHMRKYVYELQYLHIGNPFIIFKKRNWWSYFKYISKQNQGLTTKYSIKQKTVQDKLNKFPLSSLNRHSILISLTLFQINFEHIQSQLQNKHKTGKLE